LKKREEKSVHPSYLSQKKRGDRRGGRKENCVISTKKEEKGEKGLNSCLPDREKKTHENGERGKRI